jgi:MFS family permease
MFYVSFVIMGIGGSLGTQMVPMAVVARWFRRNTGKAYGVMAAGIGAGGFLLPVVTRMIDAHGWQNFLLWLALGVLAVGLPLSFVFRDRPEDSGLLPDGGPKVVSLDSPVPGAQEVSIGVKDAVKTRAFWFIAIAFMLQVAGGSALMLHIMPYLTSLEIDRGTASMITMLLSVVGIPSRFAMGWLCDIFRRNYVAAISLASTSIGLFLFSIIRSDSIWAIIGFIAFYSLGRGGQLSIMPTLIREHFGPAKFGSIFGLMGIFITLAVVTTPPLAGWVRDTQGDYGPIWLIFSSIGVVGVILALAIPRASRKLEPITS